MNHTLALVTAFVVLVGCNDQKKETTAPAAAASPAASTLKPGETLVKADKLTNPYTWHAGARTLVVTVARLAPKADSPDPAHVRVLVDGVEVVADDQGIAYDAFAGVAPQADGRLEIVLGDKGGGGDPGHITAALLSAPPAGAVKVDDKWGGDDLPGTKHPAWFDRGIGGDASL